MIPFQGYAPDLAPETEGIITDCDRVIPYSDGYAAQGSLTTITGSTVLSGAARGFAVVRKLDNSRRVFASTSTAIYELDSGGWTDRSDTGGYDLTTDTEIRARFAQFGNVTISAVGHNNRIQSSTSGAFAAITGAPKAKVIETVNNFVFAFNYVDDTHGLGTRENGWWCSALGDETDWTPDVANQCVAGQFIESPGPVLGAKRLGPVIVAYKERSAFIGEYVGVPAVWAWRQLPGEVGALSQECIVSIGTAHYFVGQEDFWMFDGSRFVPIGTPLRNTFFNDLDQQYKRLVWGAHDKKNTLIYWFYPSSGSEGVLDSCIVYNYKTDKWGRSDATIEAAADYVDVGITYDTLGTYYSTYSDFPTTGTYDNTFPVLDQNTIAVFNSSHYMATFTGSPTVSSITTHHIGDMTSFSTLTKVRPRFITTPSSASMEYFYSNTNADTFTQGTTVNMANNVFDMIWSARWHKLKFTFNGTMKILGFKPEIEADGDE